MQPSTFLPNLKFLAVSRTPLNPPFLEHNPNLQGAVPLTKTLISHPHSRTHFSGYRCTPRSVMRFRFASALVATWPALVETLLEFVATWLLFVVTLFGFVATSRVLCRRGFDLFVPWLALVSTWLGFMATWPALVAT